MESNTCYFILDQMGGPVNQHCNPQSCTASMANAAKSESLIINSKIDNATPLTEETNLNTRTSVKSQCSVKTCTGFIYSLSLRHYGMGTFNFCQPHIHKLFSAATYHNGLQVEM